MLIERFCVVQRSSLRVLLRCDFSTHQGISKCNLCHGGPYMHSIVQLDTLHFTHHIFIISSLHHNITPRCNACVHLLIGHDNVTRGRSRRRGWHSLELTRWPVPTSVRFACLSAEGTGQTSVWRWSHHHTLHPFHQDTREVRV